MEPMLHEFEQMLAGVGLAAPRIALISNETGKPVSSDDIRTTAYWRRHIRQPVRFSASIETLAHDGVDVFIEAGPAPVLTGMGRRCVKTTSALWLASLRKERDDWDQLLDSLSALYVRGVDIEWERFGRHKSCVKVALPTYPFQRQRYWLDLPDPRPHRLWPRRRRRPIASAAWTPGSIGRRRRHFRN
jgi:acyl transferase domain-containing protein